MTNAIITILNTNAKGTNKAPVKTELDEVTAVLLDYIEGTANGQPERLRKAFHPNFNLYTVAKDTLWTRSGEQYIANIKVGEKSNRIGRIISIDIEKDAAIAKAEIVVPNSRIFTDYFLLLKYKGTWKIVHKSYSWRELSKDSR
ncbi:dehydrogenase [Pedobacter sp. Hv1]|nr:dehydrogenase [Pedobacter sp. Hv1]